MGQIDRQTDGQTDGNQTVTLRFPLDADSVITNKRCIWVWVAQ